MNTHNHLQISLPNRSTSPGAVSAFTLVELGVVAGVLAILVLILVPALAKPHDASHRAVCTENIRRLMQAAIMYAGDNRDALPWPNWGSEYGPGWLYTPQGGMPPNLMSPAYYPSNQVLAYAGGVLFAYLKNPQDYRCPLDITNAVYNSYWASRANKLSTYVMNGAVCGYGLLSPQSYRLSQFSGRAYCLWEPNEELGAAAGTYNDASSYPDRNEGLGRMHGFGAPIGTFGGAVEWISYQTFAAEQSRRPGLLWCSPGSTNGQ
jgi:type II secretory pathway pseudopilin PulG